MSRLTRFVRTRIAEFSGRQRAPEAGIRHILVTRYNVPMGFSGQRNNDPLDPAWLDHREALFRRFTLPSVARQSVRDFEWVILFHPETPARYYSYLDGVAIVLLAGRKDTIAQLRARYEDSGKVLISSRLDNDDAIAPDYIETARAAMHAHRSGPASAIVFADGVRLQLGSMRARTVAYEQSPFVTALEAGKIQTAVHYHHNKVAQEIPTVSVRTGRPMWMQVLHDRNVSSDAHWKEDLPSDRPAEIFSDRFPGLR
jgi:hypothetical protein